MAKGESYDVGLKSGLFTRKHWQAMGDAIWTYGKLVDWVTEEVKVGNSYQGIVLGGAPGIAKKLAEHFGYSKNIATRHLKALRKAEYISTERGAGGLSIRIRNSKKWVHRIPQSGIPENVDLVGDGDERIPQSGIPETRDSRNEGFPSEWDSKSQQPGNRSLYDTAGTRAEAPPSVTNQVVAAFETFGRFAFASRKSMSEMPATKVQVEVMAKRMGVENLIRRVRDICRKHVDEGDPLGCLQVALDKINQADREAGKKSQPEPRANDGAYERYTPPTD